MPLWTRLLKLLFNKQSLNTKCRRRFHVYLACRFINQYVIGNYSDLLVQYQSCVRSARPKQK